MTAEILLTDSPRRQARIAVGSGDNKLTWTFDAPGISDVVWQELTCHGFSKEMDPAILKGETREARDFRDRVSTVIATLTGAVMSLERDRMVEGERRFLDYAEKIIRQEKESGQSPSRVDKYKVAVSRFRQYLQATNRDDILFRNLNTEVIEGFDKYLSKEGLQDSTRAFYNRILAAIYNRGVKQGESADNSPFANVSTQHRQAAANLRPHIKTRRNRRSTPRV